MLESVALVIGVGDYKYFSRIKCAGFEAKQVFGRVQPLATTAILRHDQENGFEPQTVLERSSGKCWAFFYYSGHGVAIGDKHYLLGNDAESATKLYGICLEDEVLGPMRRHARASLAVLNCCRNPEVPTRSVASSSAAGSGPMTHNLGWGPLSCGTSGNNGLNSRSTPQAGGLYVCWATSPLQTAKVASKYTQSLVQHLFDENKSVLDATSRVSEEVEEADEQCARCESIGNVALALAKPLGKWKYLDEPAAVMSSPITGPSRESSWMSGGAGDFACRKADEGRPPAVVTPRGAQVYAGGEGAATGTALALICSRPGRQSDAAEEQHMGMGKYLDELAAVSSPISGPSREPSWMSGGVDGPAGRKADEGGPPAVVTPRVTFEGGDECRGSYAGGAVEPGATAAAAVAPSTTFAVGNKVRIKCVSIDEAMAAQSGHGGWEDKMASMLGKLGLVVSIDIDGDVRVKMDADSDTKLWNPALLTFVSTIPTSNIAVGSTVSIRNVSVDEAKAEQEVRSCWYADMAKYLGKTGTVSYKYTDGDVRVKFEDGGDCYWSYAMVLPGVVEPKPIATAAASMAPSTTFTVGNKVRIRCVSTDEAKAAQNGHGGWEDNRASMLGKLGLVVSIDIDGDVGVMMDDDNDTKLWNPALLTFVSTFPTSNIAVGSKVSIRNVSVDEAKAMQEVRRCWYADMAKYLGKTGTLSYKFANGDVGVKFKRGAEYCWSYTMVLDGPVAATQTPHDADKQVLEEKVQRQSRFWTGFLKK